jgi:ribosomal protein S18 acetylase RimI-like enzyme
MTSAAPDLRVLEWDTAFFGCKVAALAGTPSDAASLAQVIASARAQGIECVYVLSDIGNHAVIHALSSVGARLVDVRITFERAFATHDRPQKDPAIRLARPEDVPALRDLARSSHNSSRFYADGRFPRELCDELFARWIENSCAGWADVVRVAELDGHVVGYTTGHAREDQRGEIGLVAVDKRAQGHGLGSRLVAATLSDLLDRGLQNTTVVTQGRNIAAQRLYQAQGFRTQRVQTWHHMWLDELRS